MLTESNAVGLMHRLLIWKVCHQNERRKATQVSTASHDCRLILSLLVLTIAYYNIFQ